MRVNKAWGDPLVLTINDFHTNLRRNVLLDTSDSVAVDKHIRLEDTGLVTSLDGGGDSSTFEQVFGHGVEVSLENFLWVRPPAGQGPCVYIPMTQSTFNTFEATSSGYQTWETGPRQKPQVCQPSHRRPWRKQVRMPLVSDLVEGLLLRRSALVAPSPLHHGIQTLCTTLPSPESHIPDVPPVPPFPLLAHPNVP